MTITRASLPRLVALAIASIAASQGQAQTSPYYLRVQEQLSYDSNIFRTAASEKRDAYSTTSLTAGLDQPYGRQRYLLSGTVAAQLYKNQTDLNNVGYDLLAGMDWEALSRLSGDLRINSTRALTPFTSFNATGDREKVMQTQNSVNFRGRYGLASPWAVEMTLGYRSVDESGTLLDNLEVEAATVGLGAIFKPNDLLQLGLAVRYSDGKYPNYTLSGVTGSDPYKRTDLDFTAIWKASGLSTLNLRLTGSNETHSKKPYDTRDFSGLTGLVGWQYQLTGKTSVGLNYLRDTGDNVVSRADQVGDVQSTYGSPSRVTDRLAVNARWDATAKVRATFDASYSRDRYEFTEGNAAATASGTATSSVYRLGAQFQYSRALLFSCGIGQTRRNAPANLAAANVTNDYSATTADCLARLTLQ